MEKSLLDYDQSLEELKRQKQHLQLVMQKMGEEWAESGAGVGWLDNIMDGYPSIPISPSRRNSATTTTTTTTTSAAATTTTTTTTLIMVPSSSMTAMKGNEDTTDGKEQLKEEESRDDEA
ncbi:hypothetical protein O0I10_004220 [Lichtheimia ornata]|uniref:Uncharacterized protein n=1 Tax=Lichtheimia ornata TaxID=688661 RepID=A0AAD7Y0L9_9FUNG|nr:uncharacterized protein O0I10_004220 [Lichtheimia ornata]KAJ8659993.1 hypothetical protein O0I10_004220 [Lichtheimia ornata]